MDSKTKLRIKLWVRDIIKIFVLIFLTGTLGLFLLVFLNNYLLKLSSQQKKIDEKVVQKIGTINRIQQAYFFETRKFAHSDRELEWNLQDIDNYQSAIEIIDNLALNYAIPEVDYEEQKQWLFFSYRDIKKPLYSYVGGMRHSEGYYQAILCINNQPGKHKPQPPEIISNKITCGQGTQEIK